MPQPETPYAPEDWKRASRIYKKFQRAKLKTVKVHQEENLNLYPYLFFLWGGCNIFLCLLEPTLLWADWPIAEFPKLPIWPVLATAPAIPIKGFIVNHLLSRKTYSEKYLPSWLKLVRLALSLLPLFSNILLMTWANFISKRFSNLPSAAKLNLTTGKKCQNLRHLHPTRLFASGLCVIVLAAAELAFLLLAVYWLIKAELGQHRRLVITCACVTLHLAAFASTKPFCNRLGVREPGSQRQKWTIKLAPYLCLAPLPSPLLIIIPFMLVVKHPAIIPRVSQARSWEQLQDALRLQWGRTHWLKQWRKPSRLQRQLDIGPAQERFLFSCQMKTLLLVFDVAGLILLLPPEIFGKHPVCNPTPGFKGLLYLSLTIGTAGLLLQAVSVLSRILGISSLSKPLARFPYGWYILLSQMAVLTGIYGVLINYEWHPKPQDFFTLFKLHGSMAAILSWWVAIFASAGLKIRLRKHFAWIFFFLSVGAFGAIASLDPRLARSCLRLLGHSPYLSMIVSVFLIVAFGGWLLRPFSWRQVFDRRLPLRFRAVLAFMISSAALPLGGLAIPFWIYARHRLWPRYEPLLGSTEH